jgi:hypothetical protein
MIQQREPEVGAIWSIDVMLCIVLAYLLAACILMARLDPCPAEQKPHPMIVDYSEHGWGCQQYIEPVR